MDAAEFFEAVMKPEFGNTMVFQTERKDDGLYFSMETYRDLALQMQRFLMARHVAATEVMGKPPSEMRLQLTVGWDKDMDLESGLPWYEARDAGGGMDVIEGERRKG